MEKAFCFSQLLPTTHMHNDKIVVSAGQSAFPLHYVLFGFGRDPGPRAADNYIRSSQTPKHSPKNGKIINR